MKKKYTVLKIEDLEQACLHEYVSTDELQTLLKVVTSVNRYRADSGMHPFDCSVREYSVKEHALTQILTQEITDML